jgi:endonuclease/exonuclease/phosphatase family metal-dependent hydrolase
MPLERLETPLYLKTMILSLFALAFTSPCFSSQVQPREIPLRVMSYNIFGMVLVKNDHRRYRKIGEILKKQRAEGKAPHILLIQEAFHERTKELWETAGYPYRVLGPQGSMFRMWSGLVVLSEYPIEHEGQIVYTTCAGIDCKAQKGAVRVKVKVPGYPKPVRVINTHLQASYYDALHNPLDATDTAREAQIHELNDFINETPKDSPLLVGGDFNVEGHHWFDRCHPENNDKMQNGAKLCEADDTCKSTLNSEPGTWLRWIDHIGIVQFSRNQPWELTPVRYRRSFRGEDTGTGPKLSDHDAVETEWALKNLLH